MAFAHMKRILKLDRFRLKAVNLEPTLEEVAFEAPAPALA
jgi:hypothetical protein